MVYGLIIPRSYNDYYSRSDPQALQEQVRAICDSSLNGTSVNPIQNKPVTQAIGAIQELIPAQATRTNPLADKAFVNSSVSTNTANYISDNGQPFTSVADLEAYSGTLTNNDYAFVVSTDSAGNTVYNRYKYVDDGETTPAWAFEYALNNSSFTAEQWAAIQSGITAAAVARIPAGTVAEIDDAQVLSGKVWSSEKTSGFATAGVVCTTAAATQIKEVTLAGFTLAAGACIRVLFTNEDTAATPKLKINNESAIDIKAIQHGQKIALITHNGYWRGANSASDEVWQPNTMLELFYDGTDFIIIGNPVLSSYQDTGRAYEIYANGIIKQWGFSKKGSNLAAETSWSFTINLAVKYSDYDFIITFGAYNENKTANPSGEEIYCIKKSDYQQVSVSFYNRNSGTASTSPCVSWYTMGY